jgi:hypothetical protein
LTPEDRGPYGDSCDVPFRVGVMRPPLLILSLLLLAPVDDLFASLALGPTQAAGDAGDGDSLPGGCAGPRQRARGGPEPAPASTAMPPSRFAPGPARTANPNPRAIPRSRSLYALMSLQR